MEGPSNSDTKETQAQQRSSAIGRFLNDHFKNLSESEQFLFNNSHVAVSVNSIACGLMAHSLFRKTLQIRNRYLITVLPVAVFPAVFTGIYHQLLITYPLMQGSLTCGLCAQIRGGYIGVCMGGVAPILLAAFVNLMMVPDVLRTPVKGGLIKEMVSFTKPVFSRLKYFLLFEAAFSTLVATKQYDTIEKLLQMAPVPETQEKEQLSA